MSAEHWQSFQKQQQSFKFAESAMPIDSVEFERQRRKQGGLCSVKSLFCCLSVLVGKPSTGSSGAKRSTKSSNRRRQSQQQQMAISRSFPKDDDSFGYNFDEQMSPRVMKRLASADNFD